MRSKTRRIKNWPEDLINSLGAPSWERDLVSNGWLPADLAVVGEADLEVVTAAVLLVSPESEQAGNVPQAVGRGSSSTIFPPSVEEQPAIGGCVLVGEGSSGLEGEPGLIVQAVGGGSVQGTGVAQDNWDLEALVGAKLVWVELITGATWCTESPSGDTRSGRCKASRRTRLSSS